MAEDPTIDRELSRRGQQVADSQRGSPAPESRRGAAPTALRVLLAVLLVLGIFALKELVFWNPPLSFTVGSAGQPGVLGDWEEAPDDARLPLRFSDGSLVELEPGARARVVAVGRAGAEIVVESGRAHVSVTKVAFRVPGESPWRFELGPFSVEVKGTRFDVAWEPRGDELALDVLEGSVHVDGCEGERSQTIAAGQGVRASCNGERWTVVSLADVRGEPDRTSKPDTPPKPDTPSIPDATSPAGHDSIGDEPIGYCVECIDDGGCADDELCRGPNVSSGVQSSVACAMPLLQPRCNLESGPKRCMGTHAQCLGRRSLTRSWEHGSCCVARAGRGGHRRGSDHLPRALGGGIERRGGLHHLGSV